MNNTEKEKRRKLVLAVSKRLLDVSDEAPIDDLKVALDAIGIDAEAAVARTAEFVRDYPKRLLQEAKVQQEAEQRAFEHFQQQRSGLSFEQVKDQIRAILEQLPPNAVPQIRAHYRELSEVTGEDARSELLDLLWQLKKERGAQSG